MATGQPLVMPERSSSRHASTPAHVSPGGHTTLKPIVRLAVASTRIVTELRVAEGSTVETSSRSARLTPIAVALTLIVVGIAVAVGVGVANGSVGARAAAASSSCAVASSCSASAWMSAP